MKKFISILLAMIMALMMCMPTAVAVEADTDSRQSTSTVECFLEDGTINAAIFNKIKEIFNYIKDFFESLIDWIKSEIFPPEDGDGDEETTNPPNEDGGEVDPPEEDKEESFWILFYDGRCVYGDPNRAVAFDQIWVQAGTKIDFEVPIPPEKTGYKFIGWNPEVPEIMPSHEVKCEAVWEQIYGYSTIYIDITQDAAMFDRTWNYGEVTQKIGTSVKEPENLIKTNYAFDGWVNEEGEKVEFPTTMPKENIKLTATWRKKTDVKVTWVMLRQNEDGEIVEENYEQWYDYGDYIDPPFIASNFYQYYDNGLYYYFVGWSPECPEKVTENAVYVAQYKGRETLTW